MIVMEVVAIVIVIFVFFTLLMVGASHGNRNTREYREWAQTGDTDERELLESVTTTERGNWAERDLVLELLKNDIPAGAIFHDLYIKKMCGYSQIDLVVATKVGILVFEVKDYSGWIFGKGGQDKWTQMTGYGRNKYRFYNPIKQNTQHVAELQKQLPREKVPFYSIIVFYGDCELRDVSFVPAGTYVTMAHRALDVVNEILENNEPANYTDKHEIVRVLRQAVKNGENPETEDKHIENVRNMIGKDRVFA